MNNELEASLANNSLEDLIGFYKEEAELTINNETRQRCLATAFYLKQLNTLPFDLKENE